MSDRPPVFAQPVGVHERLADSRRVWSLNDLTTNEKAVLSVILLNADEDYT